MPADPSLPQATTPEGRLAERLAELERWKRDVERYLQGGAVQQLPVVASLPATGREGRIVKLAGGNVYVDTGTSWAPL